MLLRKAAIVTTVVIFSLLASALWIRRTESVAPFSSPTAIRTNDTYVRAHAPETNSPPFPGDISSAISVERAGNSLTVSYPSAESPFGEVDYGSIVTHKAEATEPIHIGDGSIRLAYIGTAAAPPPMPGNFGMSAPAKYYTADLKPISRTDPFRLLELQKGPQDLIVERLPGARFIFARSNITELMPLRFRVFDARTHYTLSTTYNHHQGPLPDAFSFNTSLSLWHQTPIEFVSVIAVGPVETYSIHPTEGSEAKFPGGTIKSLLISEGEFDQTAWRPVGKTNIVSFNIVPSRMGPPFPKTFSAMFFCWPHAYPIPLEFEFYDDSGAQMRSHTRAVSDRLSISEVTGSPDNLKEIRLKHYPNLHRIIVTIPELPGLPEQNRNLQNLFDVHVPYMRVQSPYDIQKNLGQFVQMHVQYIPFGGHAVRSTPGWQVYSNTTAQALFEKIKADLPSQRDQLIADAEKNEISARLGFLTGPLNFIKRTFGIK